MMKINNLDTILIGSKPQTFDYKGIEFTLNKQNNDINGNPMYKISFSDDKNLCEVKPYLFRTYTKKGYGIFKSYNLSNSLENMFSNILFKKEFKVEYKEALQNRNVVVVGLNETNNGVTKYKLLVNGNEIEGLGSYWSDTNKCYHVTCIGTSRPLEIILTVVRSLGLKFDEIKQNYRVIY